jgi:hypothetical protein
LEHPDDLCDLHELDARSCQMTDDQMTDDQMTDDQMTDDQIY